MPGFTHALLSLNNLPQKRYEEFLSLSHLNEAKTHETIWHHHPMVDGHFDPDVMTDEIAILEPYMAMLELKKRGIPCEVKYDASWLIYNDSVYEITDVGISEIDLSGLLWLSFREAWHHPFYSLLEILLEQRDGRLTKPNTGTMRNAGCMNKLYAIRQLYHERQTWIQDFILPYNIAKKHYELFLKFARDRLGSRLAFKTDCVQEGRGVVLRDLTDDLHTDTLTPLLNKHKTRFKELFIQPIHPIQHEYRCYFVKDKHSKSKIFSIKERTNTTPMQELFEKPNIQVYEHLEIKWRALEVRSSEFAEVSDIATEMLERLEYDAGCLEFALTKENRTVFFEVNQMAGPLPFSGEDCEQISGYYQSMIKKMMDDG